MLGALALLTVSVGSLHAEESDGTIQVPEFNLPLSNLLSDKAREALARMAEEAKHWPSCPSIYDSKSVTLEMIAGTRGVLDDALWSPLIAMIRARYDVAIEPREIAAVYTAPPQRFARQTTIWRT